MGLGSRLGRGKNYARSGQVTQMEIDGPKVCATVQGTRPDPYRIVLDFRCPTGAARAKLLKQLTAEPMTVARLLADDLPLEAEGCFREAGFDLFPGGKLPAESARKYDMVSTCSCPDYANPCKHVCAVLLLLGEEIARRPLTLLELRGISEEELGNED